MKYFPRKTVIRDEKQQLLLGIRRANGQPTNMSSSVLSSDSMHIGVLAAAAHAAANHSPFTVFYNPRLVCVSIKFRLLNLVFKFLKLLFRFPSGRVLQNLLFLLPSTRRQCMVTKYLWVCVFGCCSKSKNQEQEGSKL